MSTNEIRSDSNGSGILGSILQSIPHHPSPSDQVNALSDAFRASLQASTKPKRGEVQELIARLVGARTWNHHVAASRPQSKQGEPIPTGLLETNSLLDKIHVDEDEPFEAFSTSKRVVGLSRFRLSNSHHQANWYLSDLFLAEYHLIATDIDAMFEANDPKAHDQAERFEYLTVVMGAFSLFWQLQVFEIIGEMDLYRSALFAGAHGAPLQCDQENLVGSCTPAMARRLSDELSRKSESERVRKYLCESDHELLGQVISRLMLFTTSAALANPVQAYWLHAGGQLGVAFRSTSERRRVADNLQAIFECFLETQRNYNMTLPISGNTSVDLTLELFIKMYRFMEAGYGETSIEQMEFLKSVAKLIQWDSSLTPESDRWADFSAFCVREFKERFNPVSKVYLLNLLAHIPWTNEIEQILAVNYSRMKKANSRPSIAGRLKSIFKGALRSGLPGSKQHESNRSRDTYF